jgi:hypothetical protein
MIRECFKCQTGIIFDMDMLTNKLGMDIDMERERFVSVACKMSFT